MSATSYIICTIVLLIIAKAIDYILTLKKVSWSFSFLGRFTLVVASAAASLFAIYFFLGFAEQKIYQTVNAKVVVDIYFEPLYLVKPNELLRIDNLGLVDVNEVHIYFTKYTFDSASVDKYGHFSLRKNFVKVYNTWGQITGSIIKDRTIKSKDSAVIVVNRVIGMDTIFPPPDSVKSNLEFYAIRITFRNAQNGELFIKYLLTPANTQMPNYLENNIETDHSFTFSSGPVDSIIDKTADFRNFIFKHQAALFGDTPEQLYKN
jgi:hypothetical protein